MNSLMGGISIGGIYKRKGFDDLKNKNSFINLLLKMGYTKRMAENRWLKETKMERVIGSVKSHYKPHVKKVKKVKGGSSVGGMYVAGMPLGGVFKYGKNDDAKNDKLLIKQLIRMGFDENRAKKLAEEEKSITQKIGRVTSKNFSLSKGRKLKRKPSSYNTFVKLMMYKFPHLKEGYLREGLKEIAKTWNTDKEMLSGKTEQELSNFIDENYGENAKQVNEVVPEVLTEQVNIPLEQVIENQEALLSSTKRLTGSNYDSSGLFLKANKNKFFAKHVLLGNNFATVKLKDLLKSKPKILRKNATEENVVLFFNSLPNA